MSEKFEFRSDTVLNDNAIFAVQAYAVRRLKPQFLQDGRKSISISIAVKDMLHIAVRIREIG